MVTANILKWKDWIKLKDRNQDIWPAFTVVNPK